ncbi:putative ribonuclease H-like domain-containing protein [Tanacetum coccineum]
MLRGIVCKNKAAWFATGGRHRQEGGHDYDEVFAPVARIEAIRLFLAFASYMGFLVYQLDVKSAFLYGELRKQTVLCHQLKALKVPTSQSMSTEWSKLCMDFIKHLEPGMQDCRLFCYNTITEEGLLTRHCSSRKIPGIYFWYSCACSKTSSYSTDFSSECSKENFKYLKGQPNRTCWYTKDSPFQLGRPTVISDYAGSHVIGNPIKVDVNFWARRLFSWQCKSRLVLTYFLKLRLTSSCCLISCCAQVLGFRTSLLDSMVQLHEYQNLHRQSEHHKLCEDPVDFHQRTKLIEIRHQLYRDANEKNLIQVLKIHTDDNVADLLTKAFNGPRFAYLVVHIGMVDMLVSAGCTMVLLVVILPAGRMVSAGCTMVLLVVIFPAGCLVSAVILPAGRMVSAGCTMVLLVAILPAGCFVSAVVYAANTSIHAAGLVCAGSIMFLLADFFLLVVTCFCCVQLDIADWLASATSHLVSAGSLHSCWCHIVSAA